VTGVISFAASFTLIIECFSVRILKAISVHLMHIDMSYNDNVTQQSYRNQNDEYFVQLMLLKFMQLFVNVL